MSPSRIASGSTRSPRATPGASSISPALGRGSACEAEFGYYLDPIIPDMRFDRTPFLDPHESDRAREALEEDRRWLGAKASAPAARRDAGFSRRRPAPEDQKSPPLNE